MSTNSSFTNSLKFLEDVNKFKPYQLFEVFWKWESRVQGGGAIPMGNWKNEDNQSEMEDDKELIIAPLE